LVKAEFWQQDKWKDALNNERYSWQEHAIVRLMEREISQVQVLNILITGDCIEAYPDDKPFPGGLFFGRQANGSPLHVVASYDVEQHWVYIITAYEPDLAHFKSDFRTRRNR